MLRFLFLIPGNLTNVSDYESGVYNGEDFLYTVEGDNPAWPSFGEPEKPEKIAVRLLYLYVSPLLLLLGILGNIASLIIMNKLSAKVCAQMV